MLLVADNLQIINREIARAVAARDPGPIRELALRCRAAGAQAIDVNCGPMPRDPEGNTGFLMQTVRAAIDVPLLIDTANPAATAAGLRAGGPGVLINGFSLEPRRCTSMLQLARDHGADLICFLLHSDGRVPADLQERLQLAVEVFEAATAAGVEPRQLIFDPIVVPLTWDDGTFQARAVLDTILRLPDLLGVPVRTIAGLSNLTSGPAPAEKKMLLESAYCGMLAGAGLDLLLCNVLHDATVRTARACERLSGGGVFSWAEL